MELLYPKTRAIVKLESAGECLFKRRQKIDQVRFSSGKRRVKIDGHCSREQTVSFDALMPLNSDLGGGRNRPHGQSVAGGSDPVDDCLRADADEAGRAPEACAVHDHLEGKGASGLRIAFFARL